MRSRWIRFPLFALAAWVVASVGLGWWVLPGLLLHPPLPIRTEFQREAVRKELLAQGGALTRHEVMGGEGARLELWRLRRGHPRGVVLYLHGFGDDVWGTLGQARALPEWDAAGFTFRGRDRDPGRPCTLGGWERADAVAAVHHLMAEGFSPNRFLIAGWSMGAGVALLALEDLEREGVHLGGALLECPFQNLRRAAQDHLRGTLGAFEPVARLAERVAIRAAGRQAHVDPAQVDPARSADRLQVRIALITGSADGDTPVDGVRRVARAHPDLTVVEGAGHCEASRQLPGGWGGWARARIEAWTL
ncbi:MAG: alpha/beta fold hydrolase [Acidobacteria bacterium]|nr:alpha/beta fold hydrolase [Acidobacteriota bacterium]MBI3490064.1 alpha/beta fold hydrolase [Acidobacteriota bacterium]